MTLLDESLARCCSYEGYTPADVVLPRGSKVIYIMYLLLFLSLLSLIIIIIIIIILVITIDLFIYCFPMPVDAKLY
jgi:hypothetical protein